MRFTLPSLNSSAVVVPEGVPNVRLLPCQGDLGRESPFLSVTRSSLFTQFPLPGVT